MERRASVGEPRLEASQGQGWWFRRWAGGRVVAGLTDRQTDFARMMRHLEPPLTTVAAGQVHGGSVAMVGRYADTMGTVTGCDALLTPTPGVMLLARTADCLPIFFADPSRGIVGIAHAGWRGLVACLPARVVATFRHAYHSAVDTLHVAVGPAIRACCYEVGPELVEWFKPFVQDRGGRRTCDLVGAARAQLAQCGVRPDRILDSQRCTACETQHWYSLRRDGPTTGRLTSFIMLRP
ncbi:MAG: peptidoglycan editing factor PgeF [Candidatus Omnitrophica bacterium]|nr:peptidoglycan editing factor PgeF [Candidatus Omnitrophota bacterium]